MLERVRREAGAGARGRHRMYVGMAPGWARPTPRSRSSTAGGRAGPTRWSAYVETYGRPLTEQAIGDLEIIPRRNLKYEGVTLDEMDLDAVIQRAPDIVLVDEIAHANAPGARHEKRWQDVAELLEPWHHGA